MVDKLRVAHLVVAFGGGVGTVLRTLLQAQVKSGQEVSLLVSSISPHDRAVLAAAGVTVAELGPAWKLPLRLREHDILHLHGADIRYLVAAWLSGRPLVFTLHGLRAVTRSLSAAVTARTRPSWRSVHRRLKRIALSFCLAHLASRVVTVSAYLAGRAATLYGLDPDNLSVVRNGLADEELEPGAVPVRSDAHVVGWVGRLVAVKRVDILLRAMAELQRDQVEVSLVLVGEGELRPELEALAQGLGLENTVRFTGFTDSVRAELAGMDLFVFPSRDEGWPTAVLEALAAGLPVVVLSSGGGGAEAVSLSGGGVVVDGEAELAGMMQALLLDAGKRATLAKNGMMYASTELRPDAWAAKYTEVYHQALADRGPASKRRV